MTTYLLFCSACEHTCSRTSVKLLKPKSLLSTAVWYPQRISIGVLLHAKKICNLSYPLHSLLPLASYFVLLKHYFRPAEKFCISPSCQSCRAVWAESAVSSAVAGTGHASPPGFMVRVSAVSIFVQIAPDYTELPSNASRATLLFLLPSLEQAGNSQVWIGKPSAGPFSEDQGEHTLKYVAIADRNWYDVIH